MIKCPNCSQQIDDNDKLIFCPYCLTQIKCKHCKEFIPISAIGCFVCGTPLLSKASESNQINEIEFEREGDLIKFKTKFTDTVGKDIVSTFGSIVGVNQLSKRTLLQNPPKITNSQNIVQNSDDLYYEADEDKLDDDHILSALKNIFHSDGEKLTIQKNSFKEQSKLDKEIRISLLVLLAYKYLLNITDLKRQILTDILKKFKLNSGGFRNWITKSDEIGRNGRSVIFLTPDGKEKAIEVLNEILDKNITKGIISFSKTNGTSRKKSNNSNADSPKKSLSGALTHIKTLIEEDYFKEHRTLGDIVRHLKDKKAITFTTTEISGPIVKLLTTNGLEREKGESGQYEYFIRQN